MFTKSTFNEIIDKGPIELKSYFHKFPFSYWFQSFHVKCRSTVTFQSIGDLGLNFWDFTTLIQNPGSATDRTPDSHYETCTSISVNDFAYLISANDQNGHRTKWYWIKWYGQNGTDKMVAIFIYSNSTELNFFIYGRKTAFSTITESPQLSKHKQTHERFNRVINAALKKNSPLLKNCRRVFCVGGGGTPLNLSWEWWFLFLAG